MSESKERKEISVFMICRKLINLLVVCANGIPKTIFKLKFYDAPYVLNGWNSRMRDFHNNMFLISFRMSNFLQSTA